MENSPELLAAWFACSAIGAVAVTTNTRSAADEIAYFASHSGAVGAVTQKPFLDVVSSAATTVGWVQCADDDGMLRGLSGDPDEADPLPPDPNAPLCVMYTSGTTSRPKGVVWSNANALWSGRINAAHEDLHPDDCHLVYMPLFHANALGFSMLATLWVGGRMVLLPKWSTSRFWDVSLEYGCSWLSLIGPSLRTVATSAAPAGHRYRLMGGPFCDVPLGQGLEKVKTIGWWGMTETLTSCIVGDPFVPNRPGSIGRPAPEYGIAVVRDDGDPVDPDETGHLLVKGTPGLSMFVEYLHDPEATAASYDDEGWFRTGDLVTPRPDGHISFADRSKDMLKVGGENVAASEVERVILTVPGVVEAAVVARPDERLDEVAVAFVIADPLADVEAEIRVACERHLADFKRPREIHLVRELPRSTLRKVDKVALRDVARPSADRATAEARWITASRSDPSGDAFEAPAV